VASTPMDAARLVEFLTDDETSLLGRDYFLLRLEEEFKKSWRYEWSYTLLLIGIEGLDDLGRLEGDRAVRSALLDVSSQLLAASRDTDLATRLDARRFAILLPGTARGGAMAFVERVVRAMSEGTFGRYRVHAGGCVAPSGSVRSVDDFMAAAERALQAATAEGPGHFVLAPDGGQG